MLHGNSVVRAEKTYSLQKFEPLQAVALINFIKRIWNACGLFYPVSFHPVACGFNGIEGSVGQRSIHFVACYSGEVVVGVISVGFQCGSDGHIGESGSTVFQRGIR